MLNKYVHRWVYVTVDHRSCICTREKGYEEALLEKVAGKDTVRKRKNEQHGKWKGGKQPEYYGS